ncbi:GNAT family N-acetyltransferase [Dactylosporangium sp. CA-152071]|uniref:GNAT family N-acetyltransferase n=1 Tax=Dactylosporangium sp. CA-152071 TaxID=3239933 RepID=UPI003D8CCF84
MVDAVPLPAPVPLPGGATLRPLELTDAAALLDVQERNREHLRRATPMQPDSFWTLDGQRDRLETQVGRNLAGEALGCAIARDGRILGCVTLSGIVRGPFRSTSLGYWIDAAEQGKGLTSAAVAAVCRLADEHLGLHRIEASTNVDNLASQRVLARNGFERIGAARDYLFLDGAWRDSLLFQRILNDRQPAAGSA